MVAVGWWWVGSSACYDTGVAIGIGGNNNDKVVIVW